MTLTSLDYKDQSLSVSTKPALLILFKPTELLAFHNSMRHSTPLQNKKQQILSKEAN